MGTRNFFAQDSVRLALVPLWGSPREIAAQFGYVLDKCIREEGTFTPFTVSMNSLPADVPAGGYPPFTSPTPSITNDAPFSLTGEIMYDPQTQNYNLRLYLWEVRTARLIYTDILEAKDREECEASMPALLQWLFSWLNYEGGSSAARSEMSLAPRTQITRPTAPLPSSSSSSSNNNNNNNNTAEDKAQERRDTVKPPREPINKNLLYIGLRAGSSFRFYSRQTAEPFMENEIIHYANFITAVQAAYYFLPSWAVQAEIGLTSDYAPFTGKKILPSGYTTYETSPMTSYSLMIPVVAKGTLWYDIFSASAFAGLYVTLPLGQMHNDLLGGSFNYQISPPLGATLGIALGAKAGVGNIILDIRWCSDMSQTIADTGDPIYQRNMLAFSAGYEIGLLKKKR